MKSVLFRILLLFFSVVVSLFVLEGYLRITKYNIAESTATIVNDSTAYMLDDDLMYRFKPNAKGTLAYSEFDDVKEINNLGLRDKEVTEKPTKKRIIAVGDSFTEGIGVERIDTIPTLLEKLLSEKKHDIEVVNAGIGGYSPDQEYRLITTRLIELEPTVLIWNITYPLDFYDLAFWSPALYAINNDQLEPLDGRKNWFYIQCFLSVYTPKPIKNTYIYHAFFQTLPQLPWLDHKLNGDDNALIDWGVRKLILEATSIRDIGKEKNFTFIVSFLPAKDMYQLPGAMNRLDDNDIQRVLDALKKELTHENIRYVDIKEKIGESGLKNPSDIYYTEDFHPNKDGNMLFARALQDFIEHHNILSL